MSNVNVDWEGPFDPYDSEDREHLHSFTRGVYAWVDEDGCLAYVGEVYDQSFDQRIGQEINNGQIWYRGGYNGPEEMDVYIGHIQTDRLSFQLLADIESTLIFHLQPSCNEKKRTSCCNVRELNLVNIGNIRNAIDDEVYCPGDGSCKLTERIGD